MSGKSATGARRCGVEFGELDARLDAHSYPMTTEELLAAEGDAELVLQDGRQSLEDVLGPMTGVSHDSADAVRTAVLSLVADRAIGRKHYSDRSPPTLGTDRAGPALSF